MSKAKKEFLNGLKKAGIKKMIIDAFDKIDQKEFYDPMFKKHLYTEETIPIGYGEKSDHPITLAKMIGYLSPKNSKRVLEIGTGSGYSTAILATLFKEIVTIEYCEDMAISAKQRHRNQNIENVKFFAGNAAEFNADPLLFDAIIIFAACHRRPLHFTQFLKEDGIIVFPMGPIYKQQIAVLKKVKSKDIEKMNNITFHEFCEFAPLK